jgi:dTMP kinase
MKKGLFITIEGIEGAGKSTAVREIEKQLKLKEVDYILTREPGGTEIAEGIRQLLLKHYFEEKMAEDTELLLMFASRAQHIAQLIKPALNAGKIVICDRFTDASFAYQGGGRGVSKEHIQRLADWVQGDLKPDLTILLDIHPKIGLKRAAKRGEPDRIEKEEIKFFERVRKTYLDLAKNDPDRFRVIDASQTLSKIKASLKKILKEIE